MPKAKNGDSTSRRGLLRLTAFCSVAAVFPLGAPAAAPQSGLIEVCADYVRLEKARIALFERIEDENERASMVEPFDAQQEPLFERIINLRAVTAEEHVARATAFATMCDGEVFDGLESGCWDRMFAAAMVRDLAPPAASKVVPPLAVESQDTELLRLCAEAGRLDRLSAGEGDLDAANAAFNGWFDVVDQIVTIRARTADGIRAKALVIRGLMAPMQPRWAEGDDHDQTAHDPLVWSLITDMMGIHVTPVAGVS